MSTGRNDEVRVLIPSITATPGRHAGDCGQTIIVPSVSGEDAKNSPTAGRRTLHAYRAAAKIVCITKKARHVPRFFLADARPSRPCGASEPLHVPG
jgi:hypothetical protein